MVAKGRGRAGRDTLVPEHVGKIGRRACYNTLPGRGVGEERAWARRDARSASRVTEVVGWTYINTASCGRVGIVFGRAL